MTHTQKLEKVTEAIHKACPDLLEPIFGSVVKWEYDHWLNSKSKIRKVKIGIIISETPNSLNQVEIKFNGNRNITKRHTTQIKILGQPINLPEVLRAIEKLSGFEYSIDTKGQFYIWTGSYKATWDFLKTLDQQEEPVISLLYSIFFIHEIS